MYRSKREYSLVGSEGLGLSSKRRFCIQVVLFLLLVFTLSVLYLYSDQTFDAYLDFVSKSSDYEDESFYFTSPVANSLDLNQTRQREGYLVWNPSCHIPDIDPWDKSIRKFIKRKSFIICSNKPLLTELSGNSLILIRDQLNAYNPMTKCCYQQIVRKNVGKLSAEVDNLYNMSVCQKLEDPVTLRSDQEFFMVRCHVSKSGKDEEVYTNFHSRTPIRPDIKPKLHRNVTPEKQKMSVLIIGLDSISRLNLIRTMPKTVKFLKKNGWLEMRGYNKIGDNTLPNLMAILTGLEYTEVRNKCFATNQVPLDSCPFIWKNFSKEGYVTGYGEDEPTMGTFNYIKTGFFNPPTDYYLRPFMLAAEKNSKITYKDGMKVCLGPTLSTDHIYQYATDFSKIFKDYLYFALFWMNTLSHNDINSPFALDGRNLKFLQDISKNGVLNNTFVVFLSDHGMRYGKVRETYVGWLEERLPFIYLWVPEWFRKLNTRMYSNLMHNQNQLTSPYDLHLTLQHVLSGKHQNGTISCPKCMSMFDEVPWDRSCADVGVIGTWCTCSDYKALSNKGTVVSAIVKFVLNEINNLLEDRKHVSKNRKCARLSLRNILSIRSKVDPRTESKLSTRYKEYFVVFETFPGNAVFEALVRDTGQFKLIGTVSRLNMYLSQSICMNDAFLRKYCFCTKV